MTLKLKPENYQSLVEDLKGKTGLDITEVSVLKTDYANGVTTLTIYYRVRAIMRSILLVIFLIACYTIVSAQTTQLTDVELWLKAGGKVDLSERLRLSVEEQIRFDNDLADLKNFHTEIDLRYELTEQWDCMRLVDI